MQRFVLSIGLIILFSAITFPGAGICLAAKAAPFEAPQLSEGAAKENVHFDPAALKQPVLLVFWASWCGSCRAEAGDLVELHKKQGERLQILGVNVDQKKEKGERFITDFKIPYPNASDPEAKIAEKYGVRATPTLILLDRKGEIRFDGHHLDKDFQASLQKVLGEST